MLLDLIQNNKKYQEIYEKLKRSGQIVHGLTSSAKSLILANLFYKSNSPMIFVVQNHYDAQVFYREIKNLCPSKKVLNFQCQEVSPYDQINSDVGVLNSQYEIFESWSRNESCFIVTTIKAFSQLYLNRELYQSKTLTLTKSKNYNTDQLAKELVLLGYTKEPLVENRGQFSQRGDIVDIYPIVGEAMRIEFFGDEVETIRSLNTSTQRSIKKAESITIHPRFLIVRAEGDNLSEKIKTIAEKNGIENFNYSEDLYWEGVEYYRGLLDQGSSTLFQYIPDTTQVIFDEWQDLINSALDWDNKQKNLYREGLEQCKLVPLRDELHLNYEIIKTSFDKFKSKLYLQVTPETVEGVFDKEISYQITSYPSERFSSKVEEFVEFIRAKLQEKQNIIIFSEQPQRVLGILKEWDIGAIYNNTDDSLGNLLTDETGKVIIQRDGLEEGCKLPDLNLVILTDRELFGRSRQAVARQKNIRETGAKTAKNFYTDIAELNPGDYVVHYKHGIGLYKGTEYLEFDKGALKQEYLAIEYADEARVLIPVDQVNLLSRFNINQDVKPRLSKLGGTEWERTKSKVKKSVKRIAEDLINLYAVRDKQKGYKYPSDTPWQIEIEDAFPYTETEDQLKAIEAVKSDMESEKLIDRLICGDAGYGKTEVIIRAVFKVIMEGRQVSILVPTTVLAQQHFNTFSDRYAPYPIRIGLLSRFKTAKEQRDVVTKLKLGEIDLVIGTHRVLQKDIQFKDLGLLIIDEEQRFGVSHKERLKLFRKDLDVISMAATPIPRTLHMALTGIRDISLISTPPTNRKPVKTYVGEYRDSIIRNAILHEIERGGKIFFVHNRIENIESIAFTVQELVPEASVRFAHGQMQDRELEDVMFSFVNNEFDVLVSTTIIETGLDIRDANTIIINQANIFGLSQLYQLRGRVGRSDVQAYAYLLYDPLKEMSDTARERLKAIRELTNLGSGYQLALRDMEIRGVGNVFGAEQHGHMLSVGFDLYIRMLGDTIEELRGNLPQNSFESYSTIDIKINAYFPDTWISDKKQRINEYKRLSACRDQSHLDALINEWQDRFGKLPLAANNLVEICRIKILAHSAGISNINQEGDFIKFALNIRLQNWLIMQRKFDTFIQSKLNFKAAAVGARTANSVMSLRITGMDEEQKLQTLKEIIQMIKNHT